MIRTVPGTFRNFLFPIAPTAFFGRTNVIDSLFLAAGSPTSSQWTRGATVLDPVTIFGGVTSDSEKLIGFSVNARLILQNQNTGLAFGKLGAIIAGVTTTLPQTANSPVGSGSVPFAVPFITPPSDAYFGSLWDPATDPLPPLYFTGSGSAIPTGLSIRIQQTLPQPVPLNKGSNSICIGIGINPSLVNCGSDGTPEVVPTVLDATWTVTYDDGR